MFSLINLRFYLTNAIFNARDKYNLSLTYTDTRARWSTNNYKANATYVHYNYMVNL